MEPGRLQRFARFVFQRDGFAPDVSGMLNALAEAAQDELIRALVSMELTSSSTIRLPEVSSLDQAETKKHGLTLVETALRWVVHHSGQRVTQDDGVIIGASSSIRLKDLKKGPLPLPVVKALDQAWQHANAVAPTYWRQSS